MKPRLMKICFRSVEATMLLWSQNHAVRFHLKMFDPKALLDSVDSDGQHQPFRDGKDNYGAAFPNKIMFSRCPIF